eukprot:Amastigsp_a342322_18.p2 type:complete len:396 gc:universal Amastigsp_a342322_18:1222-35(-)
MAAGAVATRATTLEFERVPEEFKRLPSETVDQVLRVSFQVSFVGSPPPVVLFVPTVVVSRQPTAAKAEQPTLPSSQLARFRARPQPQLHIHDHFCVLKPGVVIDALNALSRSPTKVHLYEETLDSFRVARGVTDWRSTRRFGHDALCRTRQKTVARNGDKGDVEYKVVDVDAPSAAEGPRRPPMRTLRIVWEPPGADPSSGVSDHFYMDVVKLHDGTVFTMLTIDYRFRTTGGDAETSAFDRNATVCTVIQELLTTHGALCICHAKVIEFETHRLATSASASEKARWDELMGNHVRRREPMAARHAVPSVPLEIIRLLEGPRSATGALGFPHLVATLDPTAEHVEAARSAGLSHLDLWGAVLREFCEFLGPCELASSLCGTITDEEAEALMDAVW